MSSTTEIEHIGIGKLLETNNLAVPAYQRSYSWSSEQVEELIDDLSDAIEREDPEYFLGSIVLTKPASGDRPQVVDGQQRLASTSMIYAAFRDYLHGSKGDVSDNIAGKYLYTKDTWTSDKTPRLLLSADDASFFEKQVLAAPDSADRLKAQVSGAAPDSHHRIAEAFRLVRERIEKVATGSKSDPLDVLREWDNYLANKVKVIVLTVADEANAFQIFETLNDRGLDLTIADLLKNFVFGKAGREKLEEVKAHWRNVVVRVTAEGGDPMVTRFIHHFWSSKHGLTRERLLYKNIRDKIRNARTAVDFTIELSQSAGHYAAILNSDNEFWLPLGSEAKELVSTLRNLKMDQHKPLLLACLDTFDPAKPQELLKVLRLLVAWTVRFRITHQLGSSKLERFYGDGGRQVRDEKLQKAGDLLKKLSSQIPSDSAFEAAFSTFEEENAKIARYYLRVLEQTSRQQASEQRVEHDEALVNLEHVLPKEPRLADWPKFSTDLVALYRFRLGNQTLMLKSENRKLGNGPFHTKVQIYRNSELSITNSIAKLSEWSPETIEARQRALAKTACQAWPNSA